MRTQNKEAQIVNNRNFKEFTKVFVGLNFEIAKKNIDNRNCSPDEVKNLTKNIMDCVSDDNNAELMNRIAATVQAWNEDKTLAWKKSLVEYARSNRDILEIYCETIKGEGKFIIVTEISGGEMLLQHNDFSFELFDKYEDISDFMVLDKDEYAGMKECFTSFNKIYQRG